MYSSTRTFIFLGIASTIGFQATHSAAQSATVSASELQKMKNFVAGVNADPGTVRKTLKRYTGEFIDCVDYDKQPAFRDLRQAGQPVPPTDGHGG